MFPLFKRTFAYKPIQSFAHLEPSKLLSKGFGRKLSNPFITIYRWYFYIYYQIEPRRWRSL